MNHGDELKVAAVFATMDRMATARRCVEALAAQSRPPACVVVADNHSSDATVADLRAMSGLPFKLVVLALEENLGNAGGVEEAMEIAFAEGADAVWILDDDSWPRPDALAAMLEEPYDDAVVLHPIQIDPASGAFTWPLQIFRDGKWELAFSMAAMPQGKRTQSRGVWTGALVSRKIREAIGPVRGELFIRGEDEEYPWRMERAGFTHAAVHAAILDHPGPQNLEMMGVFREAPVLRERPPRLEAALQDPQHGLAEAETIRRLEGDPHRPSLRLRRRAFRRAVPPAAGGQGLPRRLAGKARPHFLKRKEGLPIGCPVSSVTGQPIGSPMMARWRTQRRNNR